jgi:hypothetical protein
MMFRRIIPAVHRLRLTSHPIGFSSSRLFSQKDPLFPSDEEEDVFNPVSDFVTMKKKIELSENLRV